MKRILFFFALLLLFVRFGFAQTTYIGCVIYEGSGAPRTYTPIYTNTAGGGGNCNGYPVTYYSDVTNAKRLDSYCSIVPSLSTAQAIGGNSQYRNCAVNGQCGIIRTITVTECPIDNLEIILLVVLAGFGVYFIRSSYLKSMK